MKSRLEGDGAAFMSSRARRIPHTLYPNFRPFPFLVIILILFQTKSAIKSYRMCRAKPKDVPFDKEIQLAKKTQNRILYIPMQDEVVK